MPEALGPAQAQRTDCAVHSTAAQLYGKLQLEPEHARLHHMMENLRHSREAEALAKRADEVAKAIKG